MKNNYRISNKLCPDILVFTNKDSMPRKYESKSTIAIKDYFQEVLEKKEFYELRKFWITGCPSIGKTTSLAILKSLLITNNIIYKSFNLRELNNNEGWKNKLDDISKAINGADTDVLILDSLDEIYRDERKNEIFECIKKCSKPIIIASRSNDKIESPLEGFIKIELLEFNEDKIREVLKGIVDDFSNEIINVINNPMALSLFIQLFNKADEKERQSLLNLRKLPELMLKYFFSLYKQKEVVSKGESEEKAEKKLVEEVESKLSSIGYYFFSTNKSKEPVEIDNEIQGVFYEVDGSVDGSIESIHQVYIDFVCGVYIAKQIINHPNELCEILDVELSFEQRRALVYAGQCLTLFDDKKVKGAFKELNEKFPKAESNRYAWLIQIWCAYRDNKLENTREFQISKITYILNHSFVQDCVEICIPIDRGWSPQNMGKRLIVNGERKFLISKQYCSYSFDEYFWWISHRDSQDVKREKKAKQLISINKAIGKVWSWVPWGEDKDLFKIGTFLIFLLGIIFAVVLCFGAIELPFLTKIVLSFRTWFLQLCQIDHYASSYTFGEAMAIGLCNILVLLFCYIPALFMHILFLILCIVPYAILQVCYRIRLRSFIKDNLYHYLLIGYGADSFSSDCRQENPLENIVFFPSLYEYYENSEKIIKKVCDKKQSSVMMKKLVEFKNHCMNIIEQIVSTDKNMNRQGAIETARKMYDEAINTKDKMVIAVYYRIINEFRYATDEEYELLRKQIHGKTLLK